MFRRPSCIVVEMLFSDPLAQRAIPKRCREEAYPPRSAERPTCTGRTTPAAQRITPETLWQKPSGGSPLVSVSSLGPPSTVVHRIKVTHGGS